MVCQRLLRAVPGREVQHKRSVVHLRLQFLDFTDHGGRRSVQNYVAGERPVVAGAGADGAEIARGVAAAEMGEIAHDAGFAFALGLGIGLGDINPTRHAT